MTTPVQTQVTTTISPNSGPDLELLIEPEQGFFDDTDVHLLLFPAVDASLAASVGTVKFNGEKTVDVLPGVISFSGASAARLPKLPTGTNPQIEILQAFGADGNPAQVSVSLDALTGEIVASAEIYGAVKFSGYRAKARKIKYTPSLERLGEGTRAGFGSIHAFYPPRSQTIYQVQPYGVTFGELEQELYRIVSYSVTNSDGAFENPPNYPASGAYPDRSFVLDTSNTLQTERVHEIGFISPTGYCFIRTYYVRIREPYASDANYVPTKKFIESQLPQGMDKALIARAKDFVAKQGKGKV
jgi:hypothetical protein